MKTKSLVLMASLFAMSFSTFAETSTYKIRWVLAHEPIGLFKEAAEVFKKEVSEKSNGNIAVEVLTLPEYETKYNNGHKISNKKYLSKIQSGQIEMSQTYTTSLGKVSQSMYALDLPYLFRNHDHAQKVLEGDVGNKLLADLSKAKLRGLAFTYSGGYRIVPGTKAISKMEDFKGLNIRTSESPIAQDTFKLLGANPIPMTLDQVDAGLKSGKINEAESTYARYFTLGQNKVATIVNETQHSLFLTSIIVNDKFWNSLPQNYKDIMKNAAVSAARVERQHSIVASEDTKKKCIENGIKIYTLDKKEEDRVKAALQPVYKKYEPMLGRELISQIQAQ
jgi:tripartite ATP-independent transporter DctP family solute receptor